MKTIGIDARFYGTQAKGLGRYTQELIKHLAQLEHDYRFKIFLNAQGREEYDITDNRFEAVALDVPWYGLAEQRAVPKAFKQGGVGLAHIPHFNAPYFLSMPYILTLHDTILFDHPSRRASMLSWPAYHLKYNAFKHHFRHVARNAATILTVSSYARERIVYHTGISQDKITVTPIAPSSALIVNHATARVNLSQPFLLYVGNAYPHKNLQFLVRTFKEFWAQHREYRLVLVGGLDDFYRRLAEDLKKMDWQGSDCPVRIFGQATEQELADLYLQAALYVFPSLDEGFGIPPLEAMSLGLPVLSSNAASMPEVLGDAAVYFDPRDQQDMLRQLNRILYEPGLREKCINNGKAHVKRYSWKRCAEQTLAVYRRFA